jgi:hypothetical protein
MCHARLAAGPSVTAAWTKGMGMMDGCVVRGALVREGSAVRCGAVSQGHRRPQSFTVLLPHRDL